jgi:hypothetical protein
MLDGLDQGGAPRMHGVLVGRCGQGRVSSAFGARECVRCRWSPCGSTARAVGCSSTQESSFRDGVRKSAMADVVSHLFLLLRGLEDAARDI